MGLINELRMLAEDLYVNGYNRYSAAMSKAADELGSLERYRTAYNEWVAKTEWVQADTTLPAKYLGMHRADVLKDMISELLDRLEAAENKLETERMRLAACSVAALGYFDGCAKEYTSASLDDVLNLRKRLEAAGKESDALRAENAALVDDMNLLRNNNTALRAKIGAMERQKPVGWLFDGDFYEVRQMSLYKDNEPLQGQTALYALHGAPEQEPTRDWWDCLIADISAIDCMYRGSPTYAHDAYWMRDHVVWMLKKRRDTLPGAQTKGEEK